MNKQKFKIILTDIRFWIVILFVLRLIGITNAPLEVGHNWRQSLTNMIARNFVEIDANIFYPRIDMAGQQSGIIGSEFPFFNYLIYLFSSIFNYSHWVGRLINLTVSSIGIFYFYKLIKNIFNQTVAFNSTIILLVSIWFAFSRKIMPDTFSVALVIIGLYYAYYFLKNGTKISLLAFFVFTTLGVLCKIPALSLLSVLTVILFIKEIKIQRKIAIIVAGGISFSIICIWYFYWVPYLLDTYHYQLYFPKGFLDGIREITPYVPELLEKFYFSSLHSYIAFVCCLAGVFILIKNKQKYLIYSIGIITLVFVLFIIKTGAVFPLHNYYIIPFTPIMALLAGYAIDKMPTKYQYILLLLISTEAIANQQHDFRIKDSQLYKLELDGITKQIIPKNELIIINGGPSPQHIYFSHRKGWTIENAQMTNPQFIDSLKTLGAKYIIIDQHKLQNPEIKGEEVYLDENYKIITLK